MGRALSGLVVLAVLAAAAPRASAQQPIARIINGQPTGDFAAVGIVGTADTGGYCTGTLLSPTHVLTAGHCAQFIEGAAEGTFEVEGNTYRTVAVDIHPGFDPVTLENDLAILTLAEPVRDVEPAEIFRGTPLVGDELTIVGYGSGGTPEQGADGLFGTKMVGVTFIDDVDERFVYWNFDDASESNTAPGDSGGPGFLQVAGQMQIASITSGGYRQDAALGDTAFNTRVDTFAAWIDAIVMVDTPTDDGPIGENPTDEPPTDEQPTDDEPTDEQPTEETPNDEEADAAACPSHSGPVREAVREIFASVLEFLSSDSFVSLLEDLIAELRGEAE